MKKLLLLLAMTLCAGIFESCNKDKGEDVISISDLTMDFTISNTMPLVGDEINFINNSDDKIKLFSWNFGDQTTSNEKNSSHTFTVPGTYTITLTGTLGDDSKAVEKIIVVQTSFIQPTASFDLPDLLQTKCPVIFTTTSSNAIEYSWDFGDGVTSTLASPSHTYQAAGTYNISLIVRNGDLEDEDDMSVIINEGTGIDEIPETSLTFAKDVIAFQDGYYIGAETAESTKIYKKDNIGNTVWQSIYGASDKHSFEKMETLSNGNIALATTVVGGSEENIGYIIIDANGNEIFRNFQDFAGQQFALGILPLSNGTFVVYGRDLYNGNNSGYMICVDENSGSILWSKLYEESFEDLLSSGVSNSDGSFILGGSRTDAGTTTNKKSLLLKYDSAGNLLWDKTGSILSQPIISTMLRLDNSSIYVIGNASVTVITNDGDPNFTKNFTPNGSGELRITNAIKSNDKILATGTSSTGFISSTAYAIQFDSNGNTDWQSYYNVPGGSVGFSGAVDYNTCNYLFVGSKIENGSINISTVLYRVNKDGTL